MFDKLKNFSLRLIYELDKASNEGGEFKDFDTWLHEFDDELIRNFPKDKSKSKSDFNKKLKEIRLYKAKESNENSDYKRKQNQKKLKEKLQRKYKNPIKESSIEDKKSDIYKSKKRLKKSELKKAIIYSEIIAKPKSKR